jgi:type IV pilus assembly protein PilW
MNAPRQISGFSLTEMLVAVTIGLLVLAGVTTMLVNSKATYTTQDSLARLQENARFAIEFITRDLRQAGYYGCADDVTAVNNDVANAGASLWDTNRPLEGWDQGGATQWYPSGSTQISSAIAVYTDAITIRSVTPLTVNGNPVQVTAPYMPQPSAALQIVANNGLNQGEIVAVTDCSSTDVFQISGPANVGAVGTLNHNAGTAVSPGNVTGNLSKIYEGNAFIARLNAVRYYIGTNADGNRGLYQQTATLGGGGTPTVGSQAREIVEGIENMQVLYGEDTNNDRMPDRYVPATVVGDWRNVVSVRIGLLAYTIADTEYTDSEGRLVKTYGAEDSGPHEVNGLTLSVANNNLEKKRVQRRVFQTTIALRNIK